MRPTADVPRPELFVSLGLQVYALSILDWLPPSLAVAGLVVLIFILYYTYRDHSHHRQQAPGATALPPISSHPADSLHASIDALNSVQKVAEHLEQKTNRLTLLLGQAQRRIQLLEELLSHSDCSEQLSDVATQAPISNPAVPSNHHALTEMKSAEPVDSVKQVIYDLADQGLPPVQIARNLNEQIGKVELILALRDL